MKYINTSTVRSVVSLLVFGFLFVVFTADYWGTGGQYKSSPDGRYKLSVSAKLNPKFRYSYTILLYRLSSKVKPNSNQADASERRSEGADDAREQLIEKVVLTPYTTTVEQPRGLPEMIHWNSDGDFVDVVVHEQRLCRLFPK